MNDDYKIWLLRAKSSLALSKVTITEEIFYDKEEYNNAIGKAEYCVQWIEATIKQMIETSTSER